MLITVITQNALLIFNIDTQEGSYGWKLGHLTMTPELWLITT